MLTSLRRRAAGDSGFTLAEMVVGMTLAITVGTLVLSWLLHATDTNTATTDSSHATADARNVLQSWSRYVQLGASPTVQGSGTGRITSLSATSISFYANLGTTRTCATTGTSSAGSCPALSTTPVTLSLTNGNLVERIGSGSTTVDVTAGVTAAPCLFTVFAGATPLGCSGLSQSQLDSVTSAQLAFTITAKSGHPRAFTTTASFTTYSNTTGGAANVPLS